MGASVPRRRRWFLHRLGKLWLWLSGWRTEIEIPDLPRFVLIGAPHTSNWDFVHGISAVFAADLIQRCGDLPQAAVLCRIK